MDCTEAKDRLLDALEGELPEQQRPSLDEHLAQCPTCRAELEQLQRASEALHHAIPELAPQHLYLTRERLCRLMVAYGQLTAAGPRIFRLFTYRRFVAAAAAAAILLSGASILAHLARMQKTRETKPIAVREFLPSAYVPVVLAATGQGEPINVVRTVSAAGAPWPLLEEPNRGPRLIRLDSPGVRIPVDHAFYDPEESSQWW